MYYKEYFRKILIPDWEIRRQGLYSGLQHKIIDTRTLGFIDLTFSEVNHWGNGIHDWIVAKSLFPLSSMFPAYRVYITPASGEMEPHIDGGMLNRYAVALNLPISGYTGSITSWYDEQTAQIETGFFGFNRILASRILNPDTVQCLEKVEVNQPTLIRTDVIHSVSNPGDKPRFCLAVRWQLHANHRYEWNEIMLDV